MAFGGLPTGLAAHLLVGGQERGKGGRGVGEGVRGEQEGRGVRVGVRRGYKTSWEGGAAGPNENKGRGEKRVVGGGGQAPSR